MLHVFIDLILREEAELMLQEENAGPRSRVTSQSSNSSWVDIMDEEVLYVLYVLYALYVLYVQEVVTFLKY